MAPLSVLGISGGVSTPSRTTAVVNALIKAIASRMPSDSGLIEITEAAPSLFAGLSRSALGASGEAIVQRVEKADLLVVGTPVYRASYTGALKHLFDLVDYRALAGKTVLLAATGGSPYHGLVLEHQLRPLFSFFGAVTVPTGIYGAPDDFVRAEIVGEAIRERISRAATEAVSLLNSSHAKTAVAARAG
ncbi:FMN reductase [Mesorhizobium sp. WSM4307]|uniref:FMN reductase n=1 Tax=unclassified Mesorhizobium TaxID=325217 RepID=UPI000BB068A3|nr:MULTISPECIES: FMN reductase [unclassified Mesorhizobium]PBB24385.1 FMN reductase [Mesorhizobium sp. WSM4304]PBB74647.1 FMN reductase [Mesorhizobium sp. WSM4308]TRC71659.1 FMN reductase [Mesorhizobium sp. WSM4315]TRC83462.1 FMN reductase [Mesorhizobium sp. WSM4307]